MVAENGQPVSDLAQRLARHAPDLSELGPHLGRSVEVRRFAKASVVWLNWRWFAEAGLDLSRNAVRDEVESWLLSTYGVGIVGPHDPEHQYAGPPMQFHADRYGNANGSSHGGSGRVAGRGGFQAKGIGRTPLVSPFADWFHSNGCLWLEEGVREVIFAELAAAEFPHGAVPVVALIDTGNTYHWPDGNPGPHRAILVRADFVRLAHLQRSIYFGTGGLSGSDQVEDALRTRDAWVWLGGDANGRKHAGINAIDLNDTFLRIGEQHGHAHAWRLWPGPFFSSNISLNGQLVDFGSMRALPSWKRARGRTAGHGFGEEHLHVAANTQSLARLAAKYGTPVSADELLAHYRLGVRRGFDAALTPCGKVASRSLRRLFETQQRHIVPLAEDTSTDWTTRLDIRDEANGAASRLVKPRAGLFYNRLVDAAMAMAEPLVPGASLNRQVIDGFIRHQLTASRRSWSDLPAAFVLQAQACDTHWTWLVGHKERTSATTTVLMGIVVDGHFTVAGHRVALGEIAGHRSTRRGSWLSVTLPTDARGCAIIGQRALSPPDDVFAY